MSTDLFTISEAWSAEKRADLGYQKFDGTLVRMVTGWEVTRRCGCKVTLGMRMDRMEPVMGMSPCEDHGAQCRRVLDALKHMPPSDEEIVTLAARLLDDELEPWRAV